MENSYDYNGYFVFWIINITRLYCPYYFFFLFCSEIFLFILFFIMFVFTNTNMAKILDGNLSLLWLFCVLNYHCYTVISSLIFYFFCSQFLFFILFCKMFILLFEIYVTHILCCNYILLILHIVVKFVHFC